MAPFSPGLAPLLTSQLPSLSFPYRYSDPDARLSLRRREQLPVFHHTVREPESSDDNKHIPTNTSRLASLSVKQTGVLNAITHQMIDNEQTRTLTRHSG